MFFKMSLPPEADWTHSGNLQRKMMRIPRRSSWRAPLGPQWGLLSSSSAQSRQPRGQSQWSRRRHTASSSLHHSAPSRKAQQSGVPRSSETQGQTPSTASDTINNKRSEFDNTIAMRKKVLILRKYWNTWEWRDTKSVTYSQKVGGQCTYTKSRYILYILISYIFWTLLAWSESGKKAHSYLLI